MIIVCPRSIIDNQECSIRYRMNYEYYIKKVTTLTDF